MTVVVDYDFQDEFPATLPAHQWQLLLAASETEMQRQCEEGKYGLAQAHQEIGFQYRLARARARRCRFPPRPSPPAVE